MRACEAVRPPKDQHRDTTKSKIGFGFRVVAEIHWQPKMVSCLAGCLVDARSLRAAKPLSLSSPIPNARLVAPVKPSFHLV